MTGLAEDEHRNRLDGCELVSGSVVTHLHCTVLSQTADNHKVVQMSSLTRALAADEDTEVMSLVFIMGIWRFINLWEFTSTIKNIT